MTGELSGPAVIPFALAVCFSADLAAQLAQRLRHRAAGDKRASAIMAAELFGPAVIPFALAACFSADQAAQWTQRLRYRAAGSAGR